MTPKAPSNAPYVLAVAGGSASGKSRLAAALAAELAPLRIVIIPEDAYYFSVPGGRSEDGTPFNFDRPETKDFKLLLAHLCEARAGRSFDLPHYDFATHTRLRDTTRVGPADVFIVEGMHCLSAAELRAQADLTVFIEADEAARRLRRVARDVAERGRERDATLAQFGAVVAPMHDLHVAPLKPHAGLVITNTRDDPATFADAVRQLAGRIRERLASA